jgi:hypothetical protein
MRRLLLALLVVGLLAVAPVGSLAAGGGSLTVTPSTVTLNSTFTLSGSGYVVPTSLSFEVTGPRKTGDPQIHYFTAGEPLTDPCGCFSEQWTAWWSVTGDYQITSWWRDSKGSTHKGGVVTLTVTK